MEMLAAKAESHTHDGPHAHLPHLAHHFDTPEQQYMTGKIGMWIFLGTEILMFGGLFCVYGVYRYNYPEIFLYAANEYLSTFWGSFNTVVLLTSSLTMAMAVRFAQLNKTKALVTCLALTLAGGAGFMCVKAVEYRDKYAHHVGLGSLHNIYSAKYEGGKQAEANKVAEVAPATVAHKNAIELGTANPLVGTSDEPSIKPRYSAPAGLVAEQSHQTAHHVEFDSMPQLARERVYSFFQIYFLMTGLHGLHVIIGMGLIFWVTLRSVAPQKRPAMLGLIPIAIGAFVLFLGAITSTRTPYIVGGIFVALGVGVAMLGVSIGRKRTQPAKGEFSSQYFTPVDLVGLYWHLVDLIWIFLFPLLYLIH